MRSILEGKVWKFKKKGFFFFLSSPGTKKMEYKTRQWHEKCFCCVVCKNPIGTKSFIPREQEIYCAACYEDKFATRCVKCNKVIIQWIISIFSIYYFKLFKIAFPILSEECIAPFITEEENFSICSPHLEGDGEKMEKMKRDFFFFIVFRSSPAVG